MQGPKLKIQYECGDCEFTNHNRGKVICDKLNITLQVKEGKIVTDLTCPFIEENEIRFHNESLFKIHEKQEESLKYILKNIFTNFEFHNLTVNEILLTIETITKHHIEKIQKELPDYLYEIYVDNHINLKLCLTKKLK